MRTRTVIVALGLAAALSVTTGVASVVAAPVVPSETLILERSVGDGSPKKTKDHAPIRAVLEYSAHVRVDVDGAYGSGTVLGHDGAGSLVLTAGHVVHGAWPITVMTADGEPVPVDIVSCGHDVYDICVLHTEHPLPTSTVEELADISVGDEVTFKGQATGWSSGTVAQRDLVLAITNQDGSTRGLASAAELTALGHPGDSGAGVLDSEGRLVGMENASRGETSRALIVAGSQFIATVQQLQAKVLAVAADQTAAGQ